MSLGLPYNAESVDFWQREWASHIVPRSHLKFPEGKQNIVNLKAAVGDSCVREIGCGYGRLAELFNPVKYVGYDISPGAVEQACRENPTHRFFEWDFTELPFCETTLLYVVMLHVDNNDLLPFCELVSNTNRIVIGDIMIRGFNYLSAQPLCFDREPADYIEIFGKLGFTDSEVKQAVYPAYGRKFTVLTLVKPPEARDDSTASAVALT